MFWQVEDVPSVPSVPDFQYIPGVPSVSCVPCFSNREADQRLCFRYTDTAIPLLPKFQASSHLLLMYSPVCVRPGQKPEDRFSHSEADIICTYIRCRHH